jgi:plastocyanin
MENQMRINLIKIALIAGSLMLVGSGHAFAQSALPTTAQVVALDECEPSSFNAVLGEGFCHNVAVLGSAVSLGDLFQQAAAGTPNKGWDFEPDNVTVKNGGNVVLTDQGGEPHTFTEVKKFGGGFVEGLNGGEETVPECAGGFSNIDVAKTRVVQGSKLEIDNLSKGEHHFQCCLHPWMRMTVTAK